MSEWNLDVVRHALTTARDHGFAELEIEQANASFRGTFSAQAMKKSKSLASSVENLDLGPENAEVTANLVGYYQPVGDGLQVGRRVSRGEVVAIVTALGLANDVESTVDGEIVQVLVENGQPVMFGQPLARVKLN